MAITLPLPVRVAAGLLATGIDVVRSLPADIPAIPVTLVGNALKLSIKVQQEIATLATRGDELLGGVIGAPQESPSWATFDDDEPPTAPRPTVVRTPRSTESALSEAALPETEAELEPIKTALPDTELTTPEASAMPPVVTTAMDAAIEVDESVVELALVAVDDAAADDAADQESAEEFTEEITEAIAEEIALELADEVDDGTADELAAEIAQELVADDAVAAESLAAEVAAEAIAESADLAAAADGPAALRGYEGMTLSEVRGHLRELTVADVTSLLQFEQEGGNRAPFLTLLSNRLVTLDAQQS